MESLLAKRFRETVSKIKDSRMNKEAEDDVGYSTGFLNFDFRNGTIIKIKTPDGRSGQYYSIGIVDGSMCTIIGRSGCGKTTWAVQSACNIIRPFKTSCVYIDSIEGGITRNRLKILSGFSDEDLDNKIIERNTGITAENFYQRIKIIHDLKINNRSDYEYNTGLPDNDGNPIIKLEPTVYILDSFALLMPESYTSEDELSGQMAATSTAKTNGAILKRIIPMLKSANIILFMINHINQKVEINPFSHSKNQLQYLKQGETLPGGNASVYLANNIIRFDDMNKLKSDEGFGIDGSIVEVSLAKSRTNKAGKSTPLVFDQSLGFDPDLSLYVLLKENEKISGAGIGYYLSNYKDIKFSQKNFKDKLMENADLRNAFINSGLECLKNILESEYKEIESLKMSDTTKSIIDKLNSEVILS